MILDIRDEYSQVRSTFAELDELMKSPDKAPKEKAIEQTKMLKAINDLYNFESYRMDLLTRISTWFDDKGIEVGFPWGITAKASNLSKFLKWVIEKAYPPYGKFRLSPLNATKRCYLEDLTSRQSYDAIKRLFGHEINADDVKKIGEYSQGIGLNESIH